MGSASTVQSVCIMGHDFPGRRGAIRVDKNAPFATSEGGCVSSPMLLKQMMTGNKAAVRSVKWPNDYDVDATVEIGPLQERSEEHTSELQSLMRISYAVFCVKKKNKK